MSDIQAARVTDYERDAIARMMSLKPDIILIAGDFLQEYDAAEADRQIPAFRDLLMPLAAPGGVFAVRGDADAGQQLEAIVTGTNVRLLVNEVVRTRVLDRNVTLGGVELNYRSVDALATMAALEGGEASDVRLLLSHRPDAALLLPAFTRVDLAVAGHTHGGQVSIPLFGPPMTLSNVPRHVAAGGLHELGAGRRIYLTRGVGMERGRAPRLRFLVPPDISVVTLGG
jgi:predicted MPP superfamily phosphohydrolase